MADVKDLVCDHINGQLKEHLGGMLERIQQKLQDLTKAIAPKDRALLVHNVEFQRLGDLVVTLSCRA